MKILGKLWPTRRQWTAWSLPSKYGLISLLVGLVALAVYFGDRLLTKPVPQISEPLLRQIATEVAEKENIALKTLVAFMQKVGIEKVPPEKWTDALERIAKNYKRFEKEAALLQTDDPQTNKLIKQARELAARGGLESARQKLQEAKQREISAAESLVGNSQKRIANAAKATALEATFLRTAGKYGEAAQLYMEAAKLVETSNRQAWLSYHEDAAQTLFNQGVATGDQQPLIESITQLTKLAREYDSKGELQEWARTQSNLGNAFSTLGNFENSKELLEEAVKAFNASLQVFTRRRNPYAWSLIQHNLANLFLYLGYQDNSRGKMEQAVQACRYALLERTRQRDPLRWAATQNNLGNALGALGKQEQAVEAFRAALQVYTRQRTPYDWAMTQWNLSNALMAQGKKEKGTEKFQQALEACRSALEVLRTTGPAYHAKVVEESLARAQKRLAERKETLSKPLD